MNSKILMIILKTHFFIDRQNSIYTTIDFYQQGKFFKVIEICNSVTVSVLLLRNI